MLGIYLELVSPVGELLFGAFTAMSEEEKKQKQNEKEKKEQKPVDVDYEEKWKRALADYRNLQKRVAKEQENFALFSNRELILKLLPVLDDLEEAARNSEDEGYEKILNKLKEVLRDEGLEEIKVQKGDEFDPRFMECVDVVNVPVQKEKTEKSTPSEAPKERRKVVNKVVRKGYNMKGELLRPARIVVSSGH